MKKAYRGALTAVLALTLTDCAEQRSPTDPGLLAMRSPNASSSTVTAPSGLSATAASPTRIDVGWQDNSTNETGFEVRRSTDGPTGSFPVIATTGPNTTSHADTGLGVGTQYCYKLRAFSVGKTTTSYSVLTAPACATTLVPPPPPGPPQAPENEVASAAGSHGVAVSWSDKANNEDGFRVERSTDSGATWVTAATTTANISLIADYDVAPESQVCYRVLAFNSQGDSPLSNTSCVTPILGPTDLTADSLGNLSWTDNSALEDGYEVYWMDAFGIAYDGFIAALSPNSTSFHTDGCGGACHGWAVVAVKDRQYSDWAAVFVIPPGADAPRRIP